MSYEVTYKAGHCQSMETIKEAAKVAWGHGEQEFTGSRCPLGRPRSCHPCFAGRNGKRNRQQNF